MQSYGLDCQYWWIWQFQLHCAWQLLWSLICLLEGTEQVSMPRKIASGLESHYLSETLSSWSVTTSVKSQIEVRPFVNVNSLRSKAKRAAD